MSGSISVLLVGVPDGLRKPLLDEYNHIVQNYLEHRWAPSELSGGKFCEVVYSILHGHATGVFPVAPSKPANFLVACRALENNAHVPRSFQILIPRLLPALYEIRNNRGVGHVGGDVDPNHMDATAVLGMANWVLAELVRVLHGVSTEIAQQAVDAIAERRIPLIWTQGDTKRILELGVSLKFQILLLASTCQGVVTVESLLRWTEYDNKSYFVKLLRRMHRERIIELSNGEKDVQVLPPGTREIEAFLADRVSQ